MGCRSSSLAREPGMSLSRPIPASQEPKEFVGSRHVDDEYDHCHQPLSGVPFTA